MAIKVIALKETVKVQHWDFAEEGARPLSSHKNLVAAISDGSSVLKFVLFEELANQVQQGKSYVIKNYGISQFGNQRTMLSNRDTAIYFCAPINLPTHLEEEGKQLLNHHPPLFHIQELKPSTDRFISVEGCVTAVSFSRLSYNHASTR